MPTVELTFTEPHVNQRAIIDSSARFRVARCGRRFGKTEVGKHEIVLKGLGSARTWWTTPTYKMAMDVWRDLKYILRPLTQCHIRESEQTIFMPGGGFIAIRSTHEYQNLRGAGLDFVVLDEAAFMHRDVWPQVIRPMLLEAQGRALFLSSPLGRNHFWELYNYGLDPLEPDWESFHFTSYDNPLISHDELEAIKRTTPERIWQEEYLAEFKDNAGQVFRNVRECANAPLKAVWIDGHTYVMGIDWGKDNDYTVIAVMDAETRQLVELMRFNEIGWAVQRGRVAQLNEKWKPTVILAEQNSIGSVNIEAMQAEGLPVRPFLTTGQTKMPLIEGLALAFEQNRISILPDEVLINELISYRATRLPSNTWRYEAPAGGHDDTVIAVALAWHGITYRASAGTADWW
jgi:hypothetical protein